MKNTSYPCITKGFALTFGLASVLSVFSNYAHANLAVDHFNCAIKAVKADGSALYSSELDASAARMGMELGPNPTSWVSFGGLELKAAGVDGGYAALQLHYQHAVQLDAQGKAIKAKQALCFSEEASVGHLGMGTACMVPSQDPFAIDAPIHGWYDTDLKDGIPVFNPQALRTETIPFPDGSKVTFSCAFLGTIQ